MLCLDYAYLYSELQSFTVAKSCQNELFCVAGEKEYYEKQLATLKSFEEVDRLVGSDGIDEEDLEEQGQHERAMRISNYANIVLLAFKVFHP